MERTNKQLIEQVIRQHGLVLGCYDDMIEEIPESHIDNVLEVILEEHTDIFLRYSNQIYVVEIATVDGEKDLTMYNVVDYFKKYGYLEVALDNGDITEKEYISIKKQIR